MNESNSPEVRNLSKKDRVKAVLGTLRNAPKLIHTPIGEVAGAMTTMQLTGDNSALALVVGIFAGDLLVRQVDNASAALMGKPPVVGKHSDLITAWKTGIPQEAKQI